MDDSVKQRIFALVLALVAFEVHAFGATGHMVVGYVAEDRICKDTRRAMRIILPERNLIDAGLWADQLRSDPVWDVAEPWHYINVGDNQDLSKIKHPPEGDILEAMQRFENVLRDKASSDRQQREAMRFLVHFVADLHQPLHVGRASDRGGNSVDVWVGNDSSNLHLFWDSYLLNQSELTAEEYAASLAALAEGKEAAWRASRPIDWARESQQLRAKVYAFSVDEDTGSGLLDEKYVAAAQQITDEQLAKAGVRLAGLLDSIYCPPSE
ncbi:MAG: S1/P1 nuclease [Gammaproteobacteria bacterium]